MVTLLKLGGAAITHKDQPNTLRAEALARIADDLAHTTGPMLLVHGAGSFGHHLAREHALQAGYQTPSQRAALAALQRDLHHLNAQVIEALSARDIPAVPFHPASLCVMAGGRLTTLLLEPIQRALALGLWPVLYGDCVWDRAQTFGILSGDQLLIYLADALGAARVGFGTNVPGVLDAQDAVLPHLTRADLASLGGRSASGADVTGGMRGKLAEIARLHSPHTTLWIFDLLDDTARARFLAGDDDLGTRITPT